MAVELGELCVQTLKPMLDSLILHFGPPAVSEVPGPGHPRQGLSEFPQQRLEGSIRVRVFLQRLARRSVVLDRWLQVP